MRQITADPYDYTGLPKIYDPTDPTAQPAPPAPVEPAPFLPGDTAGSTPKAPDAPTPEPVYLPGPVARTTESTTAPAPTAGTSSGDADAARISAIFASQGKQATQTDIDYWKNTLARAGGDWSYVQSRMLAPNTGGYTAPGSYDANAGLATVGGPGGPNPAAAGYLGMSIPQPGSASSIYSTYGLQPPQGLWDPGFVSQLRQIIQDRLAASGKPVDPNDPTITGAVNAARDTATRQSEQERAQLAERAYAQGNLNTDVIGQQIQQSNERTGTALGSLRANLIMNEVQQRRQDLKDLLQMALAAGDSQSAREIQLQIAALNATLQEQQQAIGLSEFGANLNAQTALAGLRG
jgi:hypothetical protein